MAAMSEDEKDFLELSKMGKGSDQHCCVPNCNSNGRRHQVSFHRFPQAGARRNSWIQAIRRDPGPLFNSEEVNQEEDIQESEEHLRNPRLDNKPALLLTMSPATDAVNLSRRTACHLGSSLWSLVITSMFLVSSILTWIALKLVVLVLFNATCSVFSIKLSIGSMGSLHPRYSRCNELKAFCW
ncbi:unnamed protein product [Mytilus coruscus]|uniref:THAP-type domain-containing protein n=1 Tax=Mytilus coruscus TaxID=42192 RepID=A0A6J8C1P5_MYTCO|nr:unnamed protein product [Mytilus coruscus]